MATREAATYTMIAGQELNKPAEITLIKTGNLGAELPDLETAPNLALVLYPDRLSAEIRSRLDDAGFQEVSRHAGWLDWGHGDVVILQR